MDTSRTTLCGDTLGHFERTLHEDAICQYDEGIARGYAWTFEEKAEGEPLDTPRGNCMTIPLDISKNKLCEQILGHVDGKLCEDAQGHVERTLCEYTILRFEEEAA